LLGSRRLGRGGESGGRGGLSILQGEFLKNEVVTSLEEGGEGPTAPKKGPDVSEALNEAADDVEDEGALGDDFAEGPKVVCHLIEMAAVLGDGEVALDKSSKLCLKLDGACFPVPENLGLDGEPSLPSGGALGGEFFGEVVGESAEDPGLQHTVHPCPVRREDRSIEMNVILEGELAEGQQKLITPVVEVTGVDAEDDRDETPDVGDDNRLGVELQEGGGLLKEHGGVEIRPCDVGALTGARGL